MAKIICVPGSGDPFRADNHIFRARLDAAAALWEFGDTIDCYGRQQEGLTNTEAVLAVHYLKQNYPHIFIKAYERNDQAKSTSETAALIARLYGRLKSDHAVVVTNWPYVRRTRWLVDYYLKDYFWEEELGNRIRFHACGDTFKPYYNKHGWHAVPWWLKNVLLREILATIKARLDPEDKKFNQKRGSAKHFGA